MNPRNRRWRAFAAALVLISAVSCLGSCASLPAQGPSASEVGDQGRAEKAALESDFLIIDLDQRIAEVLRQRGRPTLARTFGDRRPAPQQVIGIGDALQVTIWEASAGGLFSSPIVDRASPGSHTAVIPEQVVARDGSITVPYAGRIKVVGLTPPQVEQRIVESLARKAIEPQAIVSISRNISNAVTISGEVSQGARVPLSPRGDRVLDVIALAGGPRAAVHEIFISLTRGGHTVTVPMQNLLSTPQENIFVYPGDTLTLVRDPQTFTAFGATGRNALVNFDAKGITVEEALAKVGGLLDNLADPSGVFLLRTEPVEFARRLDPLHVFPPVVHAVHVVYRIDLRRTNTYFLARDFPVFDKDIVYVASAPASEWLKFLSLVQMSAAPVLTTKAIGQ